MEIEFDRLVDALPGLAWIALPNGQAEFTNQRWSEYTGLRLDEAIGSGWLSAVHPEDVSHFLDRWTSFLASGQAGEVEVRLRRRDGVYRWFNFRASPIADASGKIVRWWGINTDVEEHEENSAALQRREFDHKSAAPEAEAALRVSERSLKQIINTLPTTAWATDAAGYVEFLSDRWLDYSGLTAEQCAGFGWSQVIHPDDAPGLIEYWQSCLQTGETVDCEARMRRFDGEYRWFLFRANPLRDETGTIVKWYGTNIDIEDRKRAESLLAGEKQLLAMVAQDRPLDEVLETLCRIVEHNAPGALCSVLSIDPEGGRFRHRAGPSLPEAYNEVLDGLILDGNYGPCGLAAEAKVQAIAFDVASDPRWQASPWPQLVIGHGLRACWSTPILSGDDRVIGVFAIYQREPAMPTPIEEDLIRQFAHVASIAIERSQRDAELQRTDDALRRANGYLEEAQRLSLTGSFTWDVQADEHLWSDETFRIFEIEPAQKVRLPQIQQRLHPDDLEPVGKLLGGAAEGLDFEIQLRLLMPGGAVKHVHVVGHRIETITDRPVFVGCIRDITERIMAEEELRLSSAYLTEAQRVSSTGSFAWRVSANDMIWSDQVFSMFGFEPGSEMTLERIGSRIHPADVSSLADLTARANRGESDLESEQRFVMPNGAIKHLRLIAHGTRRSDGEMEYIGAIQDVTDERRSEQALEEARSELARIARVSTLGALTASIAHEVSQPLSGIITNANTCLKMLALDPPDVKRAQETARRTVRDGNRAADVITRLRALFARRPVAQEPVDLNEAARELIALSLGDLQRRRVSVHSDLAEPLPTIIGDRVQLQQVILNLLLNAADAMDGVEDRPRQVCISTRRENVDEVSLAVSDVGVGLDPEVAHRLFEPFFTTKSEGTGIGLSVSRSIVESLGGRLIARANNGPGATFTLTLPVNSTSASIQPDHDPLKLRAARRPPSD